METTTKPSEHIGELGQMMRSRLRLYFRMDCSNDEYDHWLHKLHDEAGNIVVWWGGKELCYGDTPETTGARLNVGDTIDAEFHVKAHETYEGEHQTLVVRLREWQDEAMHKAMRAIRKERRKQWLIDNKICPECGGSGKKGKQPCKECCGGW